MHFLQCAALWCPNAKLKRMTICVCMHAGQSLLERQRRVNDVLKVEMTRIHALQMKTWTRAQYEQKTQKSVPTASQSAGEN